MRFTIHNRNIAIEAPASEVEDIVLAAADVIVPKLARKVYFSGRTGRRYPRVERASRSRTDLVILDEAFNFSTLVQKPRIVDTEDGLFIVPVVDRRLAVKTCKDICSQIEATVAKLQRERRTVAST